MKEKGEEKIRKIKELLEKLEILAVDVDITFNADAWTEEKQNEIAKLCGEKVWEFFRYEETTGKDKKLLIRIRW